MHNIINIIMLSALVWPLQGLLESCWCVIIRLLPVLAEVDLRVDVHLEIHLA